MANIASQMSDKVIFTSDNPRTENPATIIAEMEAGVEPQNYKKTLSIEDRKQAIIIDELPYQVNKARLVERIAELVREKKIEGISDLRDESNQQGVRVVIELKKDAYADVILNQLYSFTPLQTSFGVNMLALDRGQPKLMNLLDVFC
jgi:DNA gyrase/topoisomerase IV subunit A